MRSSFRGRLLGVAGIAALSLGLVLGASTFITTRIQQQLVTLRDRFVPKLELAPRLDAELDRLTRSFQDAVAARDAAALIVAEQIRRSFLSELAAADKAVDAQDAVALRGALQDYFTSASDVSRRLIANETGEALVEEMVAMQQKLGRLRDALARATRLDRTELRETFDAAARALRTGEAYRLAISLACVVAVGFLSLQLSRGLLRSLSELTAGFRRFAAGDFQPIPIHGADELAEATARANQMAHDLERTQALLVSANRELESFSYSVAHDLRSPLRAMSGFAEMLREDYRDKLDAEGQGNIDQILKGARRMAELIDALLLLSRLQRSELRKIDVDLSPVAKEILERLQRTDPRPRALVAVAEGVHAKMDALLARSLLENLLGNAWKFTAKVAEPRIEFGVSEHSGKREYFVRDNGAGFDPAYAEKLFVPFQRLHTVAEFPGTGIGLATVDRIVRRHGGRIRAEGRVDHGATFFFTIEE